MRTFIAVGVPDNIKKGIAGIQAEFKDKGFNVKYSNTENIHITLKFLGEIEESRINEIGRIVEEAVDGIKKFSIRIDSVGIFPGGRSPRVIWVGVSEGAKKLANFNRRIEDGLFSLGFESKKRVFSAHITIGRVRSLKNVKLLTELVEKMSGIMIGRALIEDIRLMKSDLTPRGPVYSVLKRVVLK